MPDSNSTQRNYAAIGMVCAHWSDLEWYCQRIAEVAAPFLAVDCERNDVGLVLTVALAHMDIRNKIATAKVLVDQAGMSRLLKRDVIAALNRIDNEYRPERNRYIHDEWIVSEDRAARTTLRPKIIQRQAFKSDLNLAETRVFSTTELEQFAATLSKAIMELLKLCDAIEAEFSAVAPALRSSRQADEPKPS